MEKENSNLITSGELINFIVGCLIGVEIIRMPNTVTNIAKQDGWIAVIIGGIYPLIVVIICSYIIKHHTNKNLNALLKNFYGKKLGTIFSFLFLIQFLIYIPQMINDALNINRIYISAFVTSTKLAYLYIILCAYVASRGIKTLVKANSLVVIFIISLLTIAMSALTYGHIDNLMPVGEASFKQLMNASLKTAYSYTTLEMLLLFCPYIDKSVNVLKSTIIGVLITITMYAYVVGISIYYLGFNVINKITWPYIFVTESVHFSFINNFKFLFIFLWQFMIVTTICDEYYILSYSLSDLTNISYKKWCVYIIPIIILLYHIFEKITLSELFNYIVPILVIFNLFIIFSLAIFTKFKNYIN